MLFFKCLQEPIYFSIVEVVSCLVYFGIEGFEFFADGSLLDLLVVGISHYHFVEIFQEVFPENGFGILVKLFDIFAVIACANKFSESRIVFGCLPLLLQYDFAKCCILFVGWCLVYRNISSGIDVVISLDDCRVSRRRTPAG